MAKELKGRRNPQFDLSIPEQKRAYDFLGKTGREQSIYLSHIVNKFLDENGVTDVDALSRSDIKKLFKNNGEVIQRDVASEEEKLREAIRQVLKEQGIAGLLAEEQKAHDELSVKKEATKQKAHDELSESYVVEDTEDDVEEEDDSLGLNEDLLSELSAFG